VSVVPTLVCVVAGVALAVGFAVAEITGVRALGGVVLVLAGAWCGRQWWRSAGPARAVGGEVVFVAAFVIAHPLGRALGAWPAVIIVSVATAALTYRITARGA
jgi:hypothetical protein